MEQDFSTNGSTEAGRIEAIKHTEWLLIVFFLFHALFEHQFFIEELVLYCLGTQFPDILESFAFRVIPEPELRRSLTHSPFIAVGVLIIGYTFSLPLYWVFSIGCLGHLFLDIFAGGDPIYLFGPFSSFCSILVVDRDTRLRFGKIVYEKVGYLWPDQTNEDLGWFWVLQFFGSVLAGTAFCVYLIVMF
jgi:hypothetical protein